VIFVGRAAGERQREDQEQKQDPVHGAQPASCLADFFLDREAVEGYKDVY